MKKIILKFSVLSVFAFSIYLINSLGLTNKNNAINVSNISYIENIDNIKIGGGVKGLIEFNYRGNTFDVLSNILSKIKPNKKDFITILREKESLDYIITLTNKNNMINSGKQLTYCLVKKTKSFLNNNVRCREGTIWYK